MVLRKRIVKRKVIKKRKYKKKNSGIARFVKNFILFSLFGFFVISSIAGVILYQKYIKPLPSVKDLGNLKIAESSVIYDKNGNELYKIYKEKRTYVSYEDINNNMVNAIVAGEDKRFFTNPGVDLIGIFRAFVYYTIGKTKKLEGTSTISQQLIRNTVITNERKIERKIKEIYLSYKMTKGLSKQKILELYLNKISFGSNAYGIEQASNTFFNKKAKDLGVLESSILASLPKGPTYYSPYNNPDRLLGYPYTYIESDPEDIIKIITKNDAISQKKLLSLLENFLGNLKLKGISESKAILCGLERKNIKENINIDNDGCSIINYSDLLVLLNSIKIKSSESTIEYQTGRKDFILGRMLEDKYITFDQYKKSLLDSFAYNFEEYRENIKYPHFVFYVREYLEKKYGKDLIEKGGLKIYTSIDPDMQDKAQELIEKYSEINKTKFDANNAALISINNETGEIISMVGARDYFDKENKGNVNIITSRLQPGSTFKPFVYAMSINKNPIGTKTPIYDLETDFPGKYTPANFDGKFEGKMTIATALNHSRNIPAIKMFYLAGGETSIINFMKKLGVITLGKFKEEYLENHNKQYTYGASMSLGTGLMTPLELAGAYSVFANMGKKVDITPIIKIVDSKGLIIEELKEIQKKKEVISPGLAYIINHILTDTSSRPTFWNNYLTLKGRSVAAKTGTSTKQYEKGGKKYIFPRNLWTIGYTPQITTVVWAGNTNGRELNYKGNGLEGAGSIWKDFMNFAHKGKNIKIWKAPSGVKTTTISSVSGLLPSDGMENKFKISSLFINSPINYDNSFKPIKVDALCNGKITDSTPEAAIKEVHLLKLHSLKPNNSRWENPVKKRIKEGGYTKEYGKISNIITKISEEACERDSLESKIEIKSTIKSGDIFVNGPNYIELAYRSNNPIIKLDIFLGDNKVSEIKLSSKLKGVYKGIFQIPNGYYGEYSLKIRAVDNLFYSNEEIKYIEIIKKDKTPPKIIITNPSDSNIKIYLGDFFNLRGKIEERTGIRSINIYIDDKPVKIGIKDRKISYPINSKNLGLGKHTIKIEAIDTNFSIGKKEIYMEIIKK